MTESHSDAESPNEVNPEEFSIEEAVNRVEEIISMLEEGDVSLAEGKQLHEEATVLLSYIEDEVTLGDGELERVDPS